MTGELPVACLRSVDPAPDRSARALGHQPALDGVRGIAVSLVVSFHAFGLHNGGTVGVEIFFVLSGFLITTLLLEEFERTGTLSFRRFYARRALRLFPLLYLTLALVSASVLFMGADRSWYLGSIAACALYLGNIYGVVATRHDLAPGVAHFWSLAVEEQFYVAWPLFALFLLRRVGEGRRLMFAVVALGIAAVAVRTGLRLTDRTTWTLPTTYGDALLLGCGLALARRTGWFQRLGRVRAIALGTLFWPVLAITFILPNLNLEDHLGIGYLAIAAIGGLAVTATQVPGAAVRALALPPLTFLGVISYGLYVIHWPVVLLLEAHTGLTSWRMGLCAVLLSVPLAWLSRRWFEAWFLRRRPRSFPTTSFEPAVPSINHTG
jgi:peptidoglycan/LPS O-acetylase OafA/YrhL